MLKVSLVTAVYNRAAFVEASVRSMLAQDYEGAFEVVVIDDGSSDDTLKVLGSIKDKRLHVIAQQQNTGFTIAIRNAVAACKGEYIAIVDGGDICFPSRIATQAGFLDANPAVVAVGSWVELYEEGSGKTSVVKLDATSNPAATLLKKSIFWHSEVMFRKDAYDKVGGYRPEFYYSQDNDLWLRLSEVGELAVIPQVLQRIIKFAGGITTTPQKLAMARAHRAMAVYCARERRAGRPDPISKFGRAAMSLRPRSATLAHALAVDGLKNTLRENAPVGRWLTAFALQEMPTPQTLACYLLARTPGLHLVRRAVRALKHRK